MGACSSKKPVHPPSSDKKYSTIPSDGGGERRIKNSIIYNKETLKARAEKRKQLEEINKKHKDALEKADAEHAKAAEGESAAAAPAGEAASGAPGAAPAAAEAAAGREGGGDAADDGADSAGSE